MAGGELKLAMLGLVEGNGHPFSWSAIVNGQYDAAVMAECGYPVIPQYLAANADRLGIDGARVTHVWCDNPAHAEQVSKASCVATVVDRPTDVIGHVDAVFIATDIGSEHIARAKPFIDAGIPTFIDKPLADNRDDLQQFIRWYRSGKRIMSTSCMRYAQEILALKNADIGELRLATAFTCKSWERYGIHALEGLYPLIGSGIVSVRNVGVEHRDCVRLTHRSGADAQLWAYYDAFGGFGAYQLIGTKGYAAAKFADSFSAFKTQLQVFINYLKNDYHSPFAVEETFELIATIVAARESRSQGGREVALTDIVSADDLPKR
jgi:predicted dehydrogenase